MKKLRGGSSFSPLSLLSLFLSCSRSLVLLKKRISFWTYLLCRWDRIAGVKNFSPMTNALLLRIIKRSCRNLNPHCEHPCVDLFEFWNSNCSLSILCARAYLGFFFFPSGFVGFNVSNVGGSSAWTRRRLSAEVGGLQRTNKLSVRMWVIFVFSFPLVSLFIFSGCLRCVWWNARERLKEMFYVCLLN